MLAAIYYEYIKIVSQSGEEAEGDTSGKPTHRSTDAEQNIFNPDCIFCNSKKPKKIKEKGVWTSQVTMKFASDSWKSVITAAEGKKDEKLLTRIRGYDLFASEARFHMYCRRRYAVTGLGYGRSEDEQQKQLQEEKEESHIFAFQQVCKIIDKEITITY